MSRSFPAVGYPFIKVTLKDQNATSLSWVGKDNTGRPDYFNSLTCQRYTETANTATIKIDYVPTGNDDPNKIENAIASSKGYCIYQYGWSGHQVLAFSGLICDYTSQIGEGVISYTLDIVSESVLGNYVEVPDSLCNLYSPSSVGQYITYEFSDSPTLNQYAWELYNILLDQRNHNGYISNENIVRLGYLQSNLPSSIVTKVKTFVKSGNSGVISDYVFTRFEEIVRRYCPGYTFSRAYSNTGFKIPATGISVPKKNGRRSPIYTIESIARALVDIEDPSLHSYRIVIDDSCQKAGSSQSGLIYLKRTGTKAVDSPDMTYEFLWNNRDGEVLSWTPEYKGAYYIFSSQDSKYLYGADNSFVSSKETIIGGKTIPSAIVLNPPIKKSQFSGNSDSQLSNITMAGLTDLQIDLNDFAQNTNYPYTAKLEVLGVADDSIQLCETSVSVKPALNNGKLHHSQGTYMIIGITDTVDSSGFRTRFDLYRNVEESKKVDVNASGTGAPNIADFTDQAGNVDINAYKRAVKLWKESHQTVKKGNVDVYINGKTYKNLTYDQAVQMIAEDAGPLGPVYRDENH